LKDEMSVMRNHSLSTIGLSLFTLCAFGVAMTSCSSADEGLLESLYSLHGDSQAVRVPATDKSERAAKPPAKRSTRGAR